MITENNTAEAEEARLFTDFPFYAAHCLKIQTMKGKVVDFAFNTPQRLLEDIIHDIEGDGRLVRLYILKARREGISTYFSGRHYFKTSTNFNRYAATITHEPEATDFLFKMVQRFHDHVPAEIRAKTRFRNTKLLEFNDKVGAGLDSAFRVATAEKVDFGSGQLIHDLHLSEVAKWPRSKESSLLTSVLQCVPDEPDTCVAFESTAKGIGGAFYIGFWACRYVYDVYLDGPERKPTIRKGINPEADPANEYARIFFPWFIFPDYRKPAPADFLVTEDEKKLAAIYNLDNDQLYWRRYTIANKCNGSLAKFYQEYPSNPQEAFLASGRPVFDTLRVQGFKTIAPKPIMRYECELSNGQWVAKIQAGEEGRLQVWEEPKADQAYIVAADVAEGLEHGDFSVADVINHRTGKQVAQWHGHIDPDLFGKILFYLGRRYNNAWIGVERNNHGLTAVTTLCNMNYPRIYAEMVEEPPAKPRKRYGWLTTKLTKPLVIDNLNATFRESGEIFILSEGTYNEMLTFKVQSDGSFAADEGQHDDRVMSLAIAHLLRRKLPIPPMALSNLNPAGARAQDPPDAGWT